ncbi:Cation Channel Sperm-Associated Protein Subunit Gamma [Manis pentadactyla]|nr:Cation Channel Sperm-Associated Protein Subunit Gamma [Manis pentadactyla]
MAELGTRGASEPELLHPRWIFRFLSLYARLIAGQCLSLIVPFWIGCPPQKQLPASGKNLSVKAGAMSILTYLSEARLACARDIVTDALGSQPTLGREESLFL